MLNVVYLTANYGIYADKEKVKFTVRGADINAERSEGVFASLPEGWYSYTNCYDQYWVKGPDGVNRNLEELLTDDGKQPFLAWYEDGIYHRLPLMLK